MSSNPRRSSERPSTPVSTVSTDNVSQHEAHYPTTTRKPVPVAPDAATALLKPTDEPPESLSSSLRSVSKIETDRRRLPPPQAWPHMPKSLQREGWTRMTPVLMDILMLLGPLLFFALAVALAIIHGRRVGETDASALRNTTTVAGTFFPILFAAIVGRATARTAAWRLERGSTLGRLEQLLGSRTIFGTLTTQWLLRSFNSVGVLLILLWALSPFGGQAALRILSIRIRTHTSSISLPYFDSGTQSQFSTTQISSPSSSISVNQWFLQLNALYISTILAPQDVYLGSQDLWGNVKIPLLSSMTANPSSEWVRVADEVGHLSYSSLVGIPVQSPATNNHSMSIESTYIELDCDQPVDGPIIPLNTTAFEGRYILSFAPDEREEAYWAMKNGSFQGFNALNPDPGDANTTYVQATWSVALDTFVDHMYNGSTAGYDVPTSYPGVFMNDTHIQARQAKLLFQNNIIDTDWHYTPTKATHAYCTVSQQYVESQVLCTSSPGTASLQSSNCSVVAQRLSQKHHVREEITALSFPDVFEWVSYALPRAFGITGESGLSDPSAYYLENPAAYYIANAEGPVRLATVSAHDLTKRLTQLINTYVMISQAGFQITGFTPETIILANITTNATILSNEDRYHVSWPWLGVFIGATLAMFVAAVFGIICACLTMSPEVLGFVSSSIRDSEYVVLPPGSGHLSGMEMSRKLKDLRLKIGAVNDAVEEGHSLRLGVGSEGEVTSVSKGAKYL